MDKILNEHGVAVVFKVIADVEGDKDEAFEAHSLEVGWEALERLERLKQTINRKERISARWARALRKLKRYVMGQPSRGE